MGNQSGKGPVQDHTARIDLPGLRSLPVTQPDSSLPGPRKPPAGYHPTVGAATANGGHLITVMSYRFHFLSEWAPVDSTRCPARSREPVPTTVKSQKSPTGGDGLEKTPSGAGGRRQAPGKHPQTRHSLPLPLLPLLQNESSS